jgi:hypothetical protein
MSDVEKYYEAIRKKWPTPTKPWAELSFEEQQLIVISVNIMLHVLQK